MTRIISCSVPYFFNSYVIINNFTDGIPGEPPHSFWLYGEPNGYNVDLKRVENCSVTKRSNGADKLSGWKVENCESKNHFVCQRIEEGKVLYSRVVILIVYPLKFRKHFLHLYLTKGRVYSGWLRPSVCVSV